MNLKFRRLGLALAGVLLLGLMLPALAQDKPTRIRVQADPSVAGLFIDGKYVGPTENFHISIPYEVSAGEHKIRLVDPRYEDYETTVTAVDGQTTKFEFKMTPTPIPPAPFGQIRTLQGASKVTAVDLTQQSAG
ncbi:MAG: PEGA domain-containing protein, partial [Bryobacterales bacterium]|nr:PEGA domain-containing protein [Bryobacterales bacterium]